MEAILYFLVKQQSKREENYPQIGAAVSEVVAELDADDSLYHMPKGASESRKKSLSSSEWMEEVKTSRGYCRTIPSTVVKTPSPTVFGSVLFCTLGK